MLNLISEVPVVNVEKYPSKLEPRTAYLTRDEHIQGSWVMCSLVLKYRTQALTLSDVLTPHPPFFFLLVCFLQISQLYQYMIQEHISILLDNYQPTNMLTSHKLGTQAARSLLNS